MSSDLFSHSRIFDIINSVHVAVVIAFHGRIFKERTGSKLSRNVTTTNSNDQNSKRSRLH